MNTTILKNLLLLFLASLPFLSLAQKQICTTHSRTSEILEQFPERQALIDQLERETQEYVENNRGQRAGLKVIPTVVHVIHDFGSENLSKATILNALEAVNDELRGQNNTNSVVSAFQGIIGDPEFELRLAKIDHQGNCTDGITRTVSSQTYSGGEGVKDLINWNGGTRRYLQVWLVNTVGSGAGGYTYLPGTNGAQSNGIVIRAAQFTGSLSHEFGHWMNLSHTWGPTNSPEESSNCNYDDNVSDTPNTVGSSGNCNTTQVSCGSLDNVQNYMDYSSCARMFTEGQALRMQAAAASSVGGRSTYWGSANRTATGTNDGFSNSCVPIVDFSFGNSLGCEGIEVDFEDNSWGADEDPSWVWTWSFPGGTPATSNDQNPTVVYNTAGVYDVTLTITTAAGSESETFQDAVVVTALGGGIVGNFTEGAEDSSFPGNADPDLEWSIETPGGLTWQRNTTASFTGNASARINLRSVTEGNLNSLISPAIDMSNVESADATMTFRLAHSNRTGINHSERLRVYASRNCGETWTLRYTQSGDNLNTAGGTVSGTFVPDEDDWRSEEVSLATMAGEPHVIVRFEAMSDRQSYLYIDDININPNAASTGIEDENLLSDIRIFPNPVNNSTLIEINSRENVRSTISLTNAIGQVVGTKSVQLSAGLNRFSLSEWTEFNAGIYLLQIRSDKGQQAVRFVIQ